MNTEMLLIILFALYVPVLIVLGAWAYQVFALKRELDAAERRLDARITDTEARLAERMNRIEDEQKAIERTLQKINGDYQRDIGRIIEKPEHIERGQARA